MNIYLVAGKAGSGKNYIANILSERLENSVVTGLAKYIKLFALELTDWDGKDDDKPREFLQTMGDTMRAFREDFLTSRMLEDIEIYKKYGIENVIVSDVRLKRELEFFKKSEYNVITIKVDSNYSRRVLSKEEKEHHTEHDFENFNEFDYIIENPLDEDLDEKIEEILKGR
jgi:phosphomevalonate kinase